MKIGIFETDHFEGAYPVIRLFDNGENEIVIFTYEHSFHQFKYLFGAELSRYTWIVKKPEVSKIKFIQQMLTAIKSSKIDIMYFNTISNNFIFYAVAIAMLKPIRAVVTLHDINGYFTFKPAPSFRRWVRFVGKRSLIKIVDEFNVVSSTMVDYLKSKLPQKKIVHCVPGAVFEAFLPENATYDVSRALTIVIPGTLDERRRKYNLAFDLLDRINERQLPIIIFFLGGCDRQYGPEVLERSKRYALKHENLIFYDTPVVDQPEFDRVMNEAHFVFIPSTVHTVVSDGVEEIYGKTISSGNIFDVIKHGKPFIAPSQLDVPTNIESSCFKYTETEQIVSFLEQMISRPELYQTWRDSALQNSLEYTPEKVRQRNASLFMPRY